MDGRCRSLWTIKHLDNQSIGQSTIIDNRQQTIRKIDNQKIFSPSIIFKHPWLSSNIIGGSSVFWLEATILAMVNFTQKTGFDFRSVLSSAQSASTYSDNTVASVSPAIFNYNELVVFKYRLPGQRVIANLGYCYRVFLYLYLKYEYFANYSKLMPRNLNLYIIF